jgi:hypothetical protein
MRIVCGHAMKLDESSVEFELAPTDPQTVPRAASLRTARLPMRGDDPGVSMVPASMPTQ